MTPAPWAGSSSGWRSASRRRARRCAGPSTRALIPTRPGLLKLDASKARNLLGWRPRLDLGTALDWIVEWTQGYRMKSDLRRLTERQIARYESLAG